MDPLADKIMVISALVCFVSLDVANVWLVLLIIFREFMVTSVRLVAADSGVVVAANNWGKAKTVSQIIAILFILLFQVSAGACLARRPSRLYGVRWGRGAVVWVLRQSSSSGGHRDGRDLRGDLPQAELEDRRARNVNPSGSPFTTRGACAILKKMIQTRGRKKYPPDARQRGSARVTGL